MQTAGCGDTGASYVSGVERVFRFVQYYIHMIRIISFVLVVLKCFYYNQICGANIFATILFKH